MGGGMVTIDEGDDEKAIVASHARLIFRWSGALWSHAVEVHDGSEWFKLAESVEAGTEVENPGRVISPTYQEIHFQQDGDAVLALLVGQSGPHHFSASFRVAAEVGERQHMMIVKVDAADRCRSPVDRLASTYSIQLPVGSLVLATETLASWSFRNADSAMTAALSSSPEERGGQVSVMPMGARRSQAQVAASILAGQATHRLIYSWSIVGRLSEDVGPAGSRE